MAEDLELTAAITRTRDAAEAHGQALLARAAADADVASTLMAYTKAVADLTDIVTERATPANPPNAAIPAPRIFLAQTLSNGGKNP